MYCLICLESTSGKFVCSDCIEVGLLPKQVNVREETRNTFLFLKRKKQKEIMELINQRLQMMIKYEITQEFELDSMIKEYVDMHILQPDTPLNLPMSKQTGHRCNYQQYNSPKKGSGIYE